MAVKVFILAYVLCVMRIADFWVVLGSGGCYDYSISQDREF